MFFISVQVLRNVRMIAKRAMFFLHTSNVRQKEKYWSMYIDLLYWEETIFNSQPLCISFNFTFLCYTKQSIIHVKYPILAAVHPQLK